MSMAADLPDLMADLHWIGHSSFRLDEPMIIYIDPWRLPPDSPKADLILVSHEHHDHCSPDDVDRVRTDETTLIANPSAAQKLPPPLTTLRAGESIEIAGVRVEAVPAYNIGKKFHPREAGHLGFVLTLGEERLYFAGDADFIPKMEAVECDVALLPVSGTYVMTAEEAAKAAQAIKPKVAVPMHYGAGVVGTVEDAQTFERLASAPVVILEAEVQS
jgi:L-ascorbate metabolism protein UlaG (beta-lactamase superfamily)